MQLPIQIKVLDQRLETEFGGIPRPATIGAAAVDVVACAVFDKKPDGKPNLESRRPLTKALSIIPSSSIYVGLGFAIHIGNPDYAAFIIPRSSLGAAQGLIMGNTIGLIDSDYTGEIIVNLLNRQPREQTRELRINPGDRIAQMYIGPVVQPQWEVVEEFTLSSQRGTGGFGSTGV